MASGKGQRLLSVFKALDWGSDIFYPLTGTTKKWPESFNNADFGHFTD